MQAQSTQLVDIEYQEKKRRDCENIKELIRLLPLWIASGISESQLYAAFMTWNGEENPKVNPTTHAFLVDKAWSNRKKTPYQNAIKTGAETPPSEKEKSTQYSGMPLIKLSDLLKEPDELVSWLVEGLLPAGGFSVIAAKPKVGKSTIVRELVLAISRGETFLDKPVSKGSVVYYALEEKKSEVKRHFQDMGADGNEEIYIYTGGTPVDAIQQIKKVVEDIKPVLIAIDPLFKLTKIKDGNSYAEVTQALEPLLRLARDTGTHVLCVHHTNKGQAQGGDAVLGSTAIFSSVDTLLIMKRHEDYRTILTIQRYGEDLPETTLHFNKDSRTIKIGKPKQEEDIDSLKEAIINFLSSQSEPVIKSVIMEGVEGRDVNKRKALAKLIEDRKVFREGEGGKGDPFKYAMSLCPSIYRDIPKQNPENAVNPCKQRANGVSQENAENQESEKTRDIPFLPEKDGVINLIDIDFKVVEVMER